MHPSLSHELSNFVKTRISCLSPRNGKIPDIVVKAPPRLHFSGLGAVLNHRFGTQRFASVVRKANPEKGTYTVPLDQNEYKTGANRAEYDKGKTYSYMMIGATGVLGAITARNLVNGYIEHFTASADVLAVAKVEIGLSSIPEGKNAIIKWRGKPIFVRHRTEEEIEEANNVDLSSLRHPENDSDRTKDPKWLVMIGVCTHLGCIPVGEAGEFGGWFCPCHGSHYDISGRIRKGPAPLNLEVPQYTLDEENDRLVIG